MFKMPVSLNIPLMGYRYFQMMTNMGRLPLDRTLSSEDMYFQMSVSDNESTNTTSSPTTTDTPAPLLGLSLLRSKFYSGLGQPLPSINEQINETLHS